jgi:hypothetical protein
VIDFKLGSGGAAVALNKAFYDIVDIKNNNDYAVKFRIEPCFPREFQLTFTPMTATIKPVSTETDRTGSSSEKIFGSRSLWEGELLMFFSPHTRTRVTEVE